MEKHVSRSVPGWSIAEPRHVRVPPGSSRRKCAPRGAGSFPAKPWAIGAHACESLPPEGVGSGFDCVHVYTLAKCPLDPRKEFMQSF